MQCHGMMPSYWIRRAKHTQLVYRNPDKTENKTKARGELKLKGKKKNAGINTPKNNTKIIAREDQREEEHYAGAYYMMCMIRYICTADVQSKGRNDACQMQQS